MPSAAHHARSDRHERVDMTPIAGRLLLVVNDAEFFLSHRLPVAVGARAAGYDVRIVTADGPGVPRIRALGFTHRPLPLTRSGTHPVAELRLLIALYRLFRAERPEIAHLVTIKPVLYGGIMARITGVPAVVAAVSGLGFVFLERGVRAALVRRLVAALYRVALGGRAVRVVFQNPDDRATIVRVTGIDESKTVLIRGSGVDLATHVAVPRPPATPVVVVMAARLLRDKGVREFVDAARRLRERAVPARFVLAGDRDPGNPTSIDDRELAAWRAGGLVELVGHRTDVPRLFADADIVVLPSYREGLPKVLLEAAACGRPVITSDVPGCRDAVTPGETGLLVPARDAAALADAIERLVLDPPLRARMGAASRALAERAFSIEGVVDAHLRIYRELRGAVP